MNSWTATTADGKIAYSGRGLAEGGTINWVQLDQGDDNLTRGIVPGTAAPLP